MLRWYLSRIPHFFQIGHGHTVKVTCTICGESKSSRYLKRHKAKLHEEKITLPCNFCNLKLATNETLRKHLQRSHKVKDLYGCKYCKKSFASNTKLASHVKRSHPESMHCKKCDKKFSNRGGLKTHLTKKH